MSFCLPQDISKKLLGSVAEGKFNPSEYADLADTEARRAYVEQFVGADSAKEVNTLFEDKMLLKDWQRGMVTAVKKLTGLSEKAKTDYVSRINKMEKLLSPADEKSFYADITAKKLGTGVTLEEVQQITTLAKKAQDARNAPTNALAGVSDEYLKAADDLRSYVASLKPTSALSSIGKNAAIIARNNLLMNPATPLKTSIGQLVNSAIDMFTRRLATASLKGLNYDLVRQANAEAWKTYRETGLNTASMESLDDTGRLGEGKRFDVPTGVDASAAAMRWIETATRKVAQASNKVVIDWEHNISFTKFYQKAFYDMANIMSSKIASTEGLTGEAAQMRAAELFKDASKIKPTTDSGAMVRSEAQRNAARVTSTNDTYTARLAIGVKDALNQSVTGLGDALMPIAKIPANIIWNGIENAGVGIPLGVKDIFQGRIKIQSEDLTTRYQGMAQYAHGIQTVTRTVGVLGAAAYFTSQLTKNDFKQDTYGDSFVKIGNVWINMEYVNAISPALAGMMEVKKNSPKGVANATSQYVAGAGSALKGTPGISELNDLVTALTKPDYAKGIQKYASTFFTSRGEPAFLKQLQSGQGIKGLFFSTTGLPTNAELQKLQAK